MKIKFAICLFALSMSVFAENPENPEGFDPSSIEAAGLSGIGMSQVNGGSYFQLQLQPDLTFGKVGVGIDATVLIGNDASDKLTILTKYGEKWDNLSTFLRVIRYASYGTPRDPFFARFGSLENVTIGHGLIMSGYSNQDRRGLRFNFRSDKFGAETLVNDLGNPKLLGGRAYLRPWGDREEVTLLDRLEIGTTYFTDADPNLGDEEALIAIGADVSMILMENKILNVNIYDDIVSSNSQPNANGSRKWAIGNAVGVGISGLRSQFKFEYRTLGEGFIPSIFDQTYDASKGRETVSPGKTTSGFFGLFASEPIGGISVRGALEGYSGGEPKLYFRVAETDLLPNLSFNALYTKRDIGRAYADPTDDNPENITDPSFFEDLFRLDQKSVLAMRVEFEISKTMPISVAINHEYRFRRGDNGEFEPVKATSFELGMQMNY